jgi:hypothetical protein
MVSTGEQARLRFLEQASETLAISAPIVSSHIRASKRDSSSLNEAGTAASGNVCVACGQLLLVGWSCESVRSVKPKQTRQQRISGHTSTVKCVQCSACGTETTIQHHRRPKKPTPNPSKSVSEARTGTTVLSERPTPTTISEETPVASPLPSKEQMPEVTQAKSTARRKARNKNASLQALLANKKPETPKASGFGLDFMDFMK